MEYIYILQTREFIQLKQPVYKIGRTAQLNYDRFKQYPKGSILYQQSYCFNCLETENILIEEFKKLFKHRKDIGREYFEGDLLSMIRLLSEACTNSLKNVVLNDDKSKYRIVDNTDDSMEDE
jgi:hypothetical protein